MYKSHSMETSDDGHAPHTFLPLENSHRKEWEREDTSHRHQAIGQDEAPYYFQIREGEKILAGYAGSARNLQVPEDNRVTNSKNAIPPTGLGDPAEGTCISFDSGRGSIGIAEGGRSIYHLTDGRYKLRCNTCELSYNSSLGYATGLKNKRETIK